MLASSATPIGNSLLRVKLKLFSLLLDPKDSQLDFRDILKHKDSKKRKSEDDVPDWGHLKHSKSCNLICSKSCIM